MTGRPDEGPHLLLQGYMLKKGHKRKNWNERWFVLKPNSMSYYVSEDLAEWKGDIFLDENSAAEARASSETLDNY